jgi:hypothetical protein
MNFWYKWQLIVLILSTISIAYNQKPNCINTLSTGLGAIYDTIANFQSGI